MNAHNEQQNIIAGALFDLMGYLTCREKKLCLSASDDAAPAVEALTEWAEKRGFDLDAARVTDWQAALAAQPSPVVKQNLTTQPAAAQEAVDFYVCDSCGHHYMDDGVTCDCTGHSNNPPLRHVRMAPVTAAPGIDMGVPGATLTIDGETFTVDEVRAALLPGASPKDELESWKRGTKACAEVLGQVMRQTQDSPKGGSEAQPMFYIQDTRGFVGNCPMWWGPDGRGYVTRLDEAGRYTKEEAIRQNKARDTDIPWPCDEIDKLARPTVDFQHMRPRSERLAELAAQAGDAEVQP